MGLTGLLSFKEEVVSYGSETVALRKRGRLRVRGQTEMVGTGSEEEMLKQ